MKRKILGTDYSKNQLKKFEKAINSVNFSKKPLIFQNINDNTLTILNLKDNKMFVNFNKDYLLYNEDTKKTLYYGTMFDKQHEAIIKSSNNIPWEEV